MDLQKREQLMESKKVRKSKYNILIPILINSSMNYTREKKSKNTNNEL
jgi:hypothetical protein